MSIHLPDGVSPFCLKLEGAMTCQFRHQLESCVIDAMRRHKSFEADLSAVREIDIYGINLLGFLQSVCLVTAISPEVAEAARQWLASCGHAGCGWLQAIEQRQ